MTDDTGLEVKISVDHRTDEEIEEDEKLVFEQAAKLLEVLNRLKGLESVAAQNRTEKKDSFLYHYCENRLVSIEWEERGVRFKLSVKDCEDMLSLEFPSDVSTLVSSLVQAASMPQETDSE